MGFDKEETPPERLTDIRNGNEDAINELWERYGSRIQGIASKYLGAAPRRIMNSEDIKNVAFMSLIGYVNELDPSDPDGISQKGFSYEELKDGIWPIAFGIAKKKALLANRKEKAGKRGGDIERSGIQERVFEDDNSEEPWVLASIEEQMQFLKAYATKSASGDIEQILQLRIEGVSSKEIARELKLSEASVCRRLKELRKALSEFSESSD
ncbi:ECF-type sigma factor [Mariniblastus fucicola]|uniref:RNA polymerase sigma factor n=1 Tax=Mariniblastus fucicola TaxID=980251 RepID=A0A5B9P8T9_9BACT|nr:ECF-type sigma factor [Mariniblastus fucicola]QEG21036.1 RNA polymerase sigma factor [Mariniblastus fucicola]